MFYFPGPALSFPFALSKGFWLHKNKESNLLGKKVWYNSTMRNNCQYLLILYMKENVQALTKGFLDMKKLIEAVETRRINIEIESMVYNFTDYSGSSFDSPLKVFRSVGKNTNKST